LAGLCAALELRDAGCDVEIFERSRLIGGRATSFEIDGREVDNGQHVFLACCTEFRRFVDRVGMSRHLYLQPRFDVLAIAKNGVSSRLRASRLPPPMHLVGSLVGYRHLTWTGRLQVAWALARIRGALAASESFAKWLARHGQGKDAIRGFWEPFVVPALNAPLERVCAADAAFVISTAFLSDPGAARFGYSTVPLAHIMNAAAARAGGVRIATPVLGVESAKTGVRLRFAQRQTMDFDAAVLAVSPDKLAGLIGDPRPFGILPLDEYEAKPIIDIHLWYDAVPLDFDFAAILDSPVQWVFQKRSGYLCCSVSAADRYLLRGTAELIDLAWEELRAALPQLRGVRRQLGAVTRNPNSTYLPKLGVARPGQRTSQPNVAIAGSWTQTGWPDTMEAAVRSGLAAASVVKGESQGA
jgi:squalene-associated FAD-dependent desaturase